MSLGRVSETYSILHPGDEVVTILVLLETSEGHLGTGDVLDAPSALFIHDVAQWVHTFLGFSRYSKRVCSVQVIPLLTLAAV